jgi:hypothetical protein
VSIERLTMESSFDVRDRFEKQQGNVGCGIGGVDKWAEKAS